jgi:hypothetical protein
MVYSKVFMGEDISEISYFTPFYERVLLLYILRDFPRCLTYYLEIPYYSIQSHSVSNKLLIRQIPYIVVADSRMSSRYRIWLLCIAYFSENIFFQLWSQCVSGYQIHFPRKYVFKIEFQIHKVIEGLAP